MTDINEDHPKKIDILLGVDNRITLIGFMMIIAAIANLAMFSETKLHYPGSNLLSVLFGFFLMLFVGALAIVYRKKWNAHKKICLIAVVLAISTIVSDLYAVAYLHGGTFNFLIPAFVVHIILAVLIIINSIMYKHGYIHNAARIAVLLVVDTLVYLVLMLVASLYTTQVIEFLLDYGNFLLMMIMYVIIISVFLSRDMRESFMNASLRACVGDINSTLLDDSTMRLTEEGLSILRGEGIEDWYDPPGDVEAQKSFLMEGLGQTAIVTVKKWKDCDHLKATIVSKSEDSHSWGVGFDICHIAVIEDIVRIYGENGMFVQLYTGPVPEPRKLFRKFNLRK